MSTTVTKMNTNRYTYFATCGTKIDVNIFDHRELQRGESFKINLTGGTIDKYCHVVIPTRGNSHE